MPIDKRAKYVKDRTVYTKQNYYLGNSNIKREGTKTKFTKALADEYIACARSCSYFAERYIKIISLDDGLIGIKPFKYQYELWEKFQAHRFNIVLAARQSGKCVIGSTLVKIKNKNTGVIENISMAELHKRSL